MKDDRKVKLVITSSANADNVFDRIADSVLFSGLKEVSRAGKTCFYRYNQDLDNDADIVLELLKNILANIGIIEAEYTLTRVA
jgi:hypothetical protein